MRVAAVQYEVSSDTAANLATALRMLDRAVAECRPGMSYWDEISVTN